MTAKIFKNQQGQLMIMAIIVLTLILISTLMIASGSLDLFNNSKITLQSVQAINMAEAGVDKAVASLNAMGGSYNGEADTALSGGSYSVAISDIDPTTKKITATGYIPNKTNPKTKKTIELQVSKGIGVAFNYGVQVGEGGLDLSNSATVNGGVYSNGSISMSNSATLNGDVYVAGGAQPTADQQWDCTGLNCGDFLFGKNTNAELDIAQSFKPAQTAVVNKVALKLRKVGSPANVTVRILGNNNGSPDKNVVKASGTLSASLVTNQYGFVEVALTSNPTLTQGTYYWMVIDTTANSSNYWYWSMDTLQGYTCNSTPPCLAKWSANWQAGTPVWNNINGDLGFQVFIGGVATSINGSNSPTITGNAYANTINGMRINKDAYYQVESGNTVSGSSCSNNIHCHPGSIDPVSIPMPISQANIDEWKQQALAMGVYTGDITNCPSSIAAGKYVGNISLSNSCTTTVFSPIWITGNFTLSNSTTVKLDQSYAKSSGVIIVDNFINLANSNKLQGTGQTGSYLIAISEFNTRDDPSQRTAITLSNSGNQGVVYSNLGSISVSNSNTLTEITGWKLILSNSVTVNYDQGLAGTFFSSGPSGSFTPIKGTYQLK